MERLGFWESLTPKIQNVYHMEIKRPSLKRVFEKRKALTSKERLESAVLKSHNKVYPDGRIHSEDEDGNYVSHSVSPYAPDFLENIEEGVKELTTALSEKGFMPISSCEGHALGDKRFVAICFSSAMEMMDFRMRCEKKFKNLKFKEQRAIDFLNMRIDTDDYGKIKSVSNHSSDNEQQLREYMSAMFLKEGRQWHVIEIQITDDLNSINPVKWIKRYAYELFLLNRETKKFTNFIKTLQHQEEYFAEFCG